MTRPAPNAPTADGTSNPVLHVDLEQHTRETAPRILLRETNSTGYSLTTTEATTLSHALLTAGGLAHQAT